MKDSGNAGVGESKKDEWAEEPSVRAGVACVMGKGGGRDTCCVCVSSEPEPTMDSVRDGGRLGGRDPEE